MAFLSSILKSFIAVCLINGCLATDLTLLKGDIDSQFKELYHTDLLLCSQSALEAFIHECLEKGADNVSPRLRLQLAVKLSICEFKEAGVKYPKSCYKMELDEDYQNCVHDFRESAQLWTTYSGHYRKLRSVCYEEAAPFVRQNILDLFFNVTKIYSDFQEAATKSSGQAQDLQEALLARFHAIVDLMDEARVSNERQRESQEYTFDKFLQSMVEKSTYVERLWDEVSLSISENSERVDSELTATEAKIHTIFEYIDSQLARIERANLDLAISHKEVTNSIASDLINLTRETTSGLLVLHDILEGNLHASLQVNHLLYDSRAQMESLFGEVEKESRQIIANITRDLRDEALSIFIVFRSTFDDSFDQLRSLSQRVGQSIFNMDAVSLNLDTNIQSLQSRITDLNAISITSIFNTFGSSFKTFAFLFLGAILYLAVSKVGEDHGGFLRAMVLGAVSAYVAKVVLVNVIL